jgi:adhesin/invasin
MTNLLRVIGGLFYLFLTATAAFATISSDISNLTTSSHPLNTSDNQIKQEIVMTWTAAQVTSATLSGYYYIFDTDDASSTTLAEVLSGTQLGSSAVSVTSASLADSNSHYFHIVAFDSGGAFGSVQTYGPIVINTSPDVSTVTDSSGDNSGSNGTDQTLTISGSRFMDAVSVKVGTTSLQSVTRNSSQQITATLPSGFTAGTYDVEVTNTAAGKSGTKSSAYTVTASNTAPTAVAAVVGLSAPYSYTKTDATSTVTISLTGADSTDTDASDTLTYTWSVDESPTDASDSSLSSTSSSTPTYQTDIAGSYIFGLIVGDGTAQSSKVQVTVTVNDPGNTPPTANAGADSSDTVNGSPVTFSGSQSSDSEGSVTYSWSMVDSPSGSTANLTNTTTATPSLTGYNKSGSYTVRLTVTDEGSLTDTDDVIFTASIGSVSASTSLLSVDTTDTTVGSAFTVSVTPKDANSNLLGTSETVVISSTLGDASGTVSSDATGTYTLTFTSTVSGTATVTSSVNGTTINASDTVIYIPGTLSTSLSTLTATPAQANSSDTITVSVTPKDQYGNNLVSGQTVVIIPSSGSMNADATETSGAYTQTYTMGGADVSFSAKVGGQAINASDSVTYSSSAPSAEQSTVVADSTDNLTADGSDSTIVTVTVNDSSGNPLSSQTVTLAYVSGTGGRDLINNSTDTTDASGTANFTVRSTLSGTKTLSASVGTNGESVTLGSVNITFVAGTATTVIISSGNSQSAVVGNALSSPLVASVTDAFANVVSGAVVDFAVISVDSTGTLSDASDTTSSNGDASTTLTLSTTSGTVQVSATLSGGNASETFTVTASADTASIGSSGNSLIGIGSSSSTTDTTKSIQKDSSDSIWLTLKDQYGNLIGNTDASGNSITVDILFSGLSSGSLSTDSYDSTAKAFTTVLTAPSSGDASDTVTATVNGSGLGKSLVITYLEGSLDVDGNGSYDALTDGIMVIRYLFNPGQSSSALTSSALGSNPTRTAEEIKTYLASSASILDVDGNGSSDALTDGIMAIRYLFNPGQSESALTSSALGSSPGRTNTEIKSYLQSISQ